jgi:hypothetical protein
MKLASGKSSVSLIGTLDCKFFRKGDEDLICVISENLGQENH